MLHQNGIIPLLFKMVIWIVLITLFEGADSSSICTGTLNHVTSSENYTEVIIDIWFSPNQNCTLVIESGICSGDSGVEVEILPFFISAGSLTIYDGRVSMYARVCTCMLHPQLSDKVSSIRKNSCALLHQRM
ncbi:uncharacterized protein LOC110446955 [Mizuhopecten yessoensis]|uniref:uncharacterized protein LOC110446955 n=1 Tax=Mizuhopecten yessoensis TaxID=6573 RepID=UPI000B45F21C|nr:uncharacterized protein LOC110446955 [Mizuhopecten yessoensis]